MTEQQLESYSRGLMDEVAKIFTAKKDSALLEDRIAKLTADLVPAKAVVPVVATLREVRTLMARCSARTHLRCTPSAARNMQRLHMTPPCTLTVVRFCRVWR